MTHDETIESRLVSAGVDVDLVARLAFYGHLVLSAGRTMNLTAARDSAAFVEHILDSLTLTRDIDGPLIDIGSGAGLPGIPLAIATGQPIVLVDSVKKKAQFLTRVLTELGLEGEALDARAETLARDARYRGTFRCATARAVSSAPTVAELTVPFLAVGGHALLQRGAMEVRERQAVTDAAPILGAEFIEERFVGGERRVLVLVKQTPTQQRFPRREGIPDKRPLCF